MFTSSKIKNDEKTKHGPSWTPIFAAAGAIGLIVGLCLVAIYNTAYDNANDLPTARLLYTSDYKHISLNLQTGEKTTLSNSTAEYGAPQISPDDQWVISWTMITEYYRWELQLQNKQTRDVPTSLGVFLGAGGDLSWSADSQWVLFHAYPSEITPETMQHNDEELWLINIHTQELKRLTNNKAIDGGGAFSPDGTQIAYTSSADGYNRLYLMDVTTGESRLLSSDTFGYAPVWSPDGRWIAFWTNHQSYNGDIWIIRADGTGAQAVTTDDRDDTNPQWLRDSRN